MKNYVFDIETVPLDTETLSLICPPFDENDVKLGALGSEKAAEKIAKLRRDHEARFFRTAALSALTAQVAAIGILGPDRDTAHLFLGPESEIVLEAFTWFSSELGRRHWIGFNIAAFDIPFLLRRAWLLGFDFPANLISGHYLSSFCTDLVQIWKATNYREDIPSLNDLAKFFGVGQKSGDGAQFGEILRYEPERAKNYLLNDLILTWQIADRMGVMRKDTPAKKEEPEPVDSIRFW